MGNLNGGHYWDFNGSLCSSDYVHQSCSVEGNALKNLVEGNQAGLFCSIVFECITGHYHLPHQTQTFSTCQILRL